MTLTNSHNTSMHESQYDRFADTFRPFAIAETKVWKKFNQWWLTAPIPLIVVRYEDLLHHRERTLRRIASFMGSDWNVDAALEEALESVGPYKPRRPVFEDRGAYLRKRFDASLRADMIAVAGAMLREFGYLDDGNACAPRARRTPVPPGDTRHAVESNGLIVNRGLEVRPPESPYGRFMTTLRKSLLDPVIADDGTPLNMDEVHLARAKAAEGTDRPKRRNHDEQLAALARVRK